MIRVERLTLRSRRLSLRDLSFEVPDGSYTALMGRTGCGKTSILEAICGLRPIASGRIRIDGVDVTDWPPAARGIGYVPQDAALFETMSVFDNLAFALRIRRTPEPAVRRRVAELARWLRIEYLLDHRATHLSGGERQRVALGRALAFEPRILCLDEPLSALDEETREETYELIRSIHQRTGVTALHVTHSLREARRLADRLLVLEDGRIELRPLNDQPPAERIRPSAAPPQKDAVR